MSDMRTMWLAIMMLAAAMIASGAGLLSWLGGVPPSLAIVTACGAFGSAILFMISVRRFLS